MLLLSLTLLVACVHGISGLDYSQQGPYSVVTQADIPFRAPAWTECSKYDDFCDVTLRLTFPEVGSSGEKFPLFIFTNGFSTNTRAYSGLLEHVASWGYVVLGWDMTENGFNFMTHKARGLVPVSLNDWASDQNEDPSSRIFNLLVPNVTVQSGYSSGGKSTAIASQFDQDRIVGYVMLDPVDCPPPFPPGAPYDEDTPEAAAEMGSVKVPGLHVGAENGPLGLVPCAPAECNYEKYHAFHDSTAWKILFKEVGHTQFTQPEVPCAVDPCACGTQEFSEVHRLMRTLTVAWSEFTSKSVNIDYYLTEWATQEVRNGNIEEEFRP